MHISLDTCLTPNEIKAHTFARDENYRTALNDARQCWTSSASLHRFLWNISSLLLRPDAIAGGESVRVLPVLRQLGCIPVCARPVQLSLSQTRELWRYQANVSTQERLRLLDLIMTSGQSLYILFRDLTQRMSAPATVHLTYLKGTAIVKNRRASHLRTLAGPRISNILSYVHIADDPADMMREMMLLFPQRRWLSLLQEAQQETDRTDSVHSLLAALQERLPKGLLTSSQEAESMPPCPLRRRWQHIVTMSQSCRVFIDGDSYDSCATTVPDDRKFSLPLDNHLIFREFGAW